MGRIGYMNYLTTVPPSHRQTVPDPDSLIVSSDSDVLQALTVHSAELQQLAVILLDVRSVYQGLYSEIGQFISNVKSVRAAVTSLGLTVDEVCTLFAFGGCDYTTFTKRVAQEQFLVVCVELRNVFAPPLPAVSSQCGSIRSAS